MSAFLYGYAYEAQRRSNPLACCGVILAMAWSAPVRPTTVTLLASQDTPIYADDGVTTFTFATHSNGAGETLFVGTNGTGSARRSLLQFDLNVLPAGSVVTDARLTLFCDREPSSDYQTLSLHTVTEAWSTGASNSDALGTPGQGASAEPGDSTWYYRSWPSTDNPNGLTWNTPGASFDSAVLVSRQVGPLSVGGDRRSVYVWNSAAMTDALNAWLTDPSSNFGWIMTGNEKQTRTVKRFISSEGRVNNWLKPNLILEVDIPDQAPAVLSLISSGNPADDRQNIDITALLLGGNAPTGTVSFSDGNTPIAGCEAVPLSGGQAVCRINKILTGTYWINARYAGDGSNPATAAKILRQDVDEPSTVSDNSTTTVLSASQDSSAAGSSVTFTASVRGGLGPAGLVTFMDGTQTLCSGVVLEHRSASCTKATLKQGMHKIRALYSGDGSNLASNSKSLSYTVLAGQAVCNPASKPQMAPMQTVWSVRVGDTLHITTAATDCWQREIALQTYKLPAGAEFSQRYDAGAVKQIGEFTWQPNEGEVDTVKTIRFGATVSGIYGRKQVIGSAVKIRVLPPENHDADCGKFSRPVLDDLPERLTIPANQTLQVQVSASDCWNRILTLNTGRLPAGATFEQSFDQASGKQTGVLRWTPQASDAQRRKRVRFSASASGLYGRKSSMNRKLTVEVLLPQQANLPDAELAAAVERVRISAARWHAQSQQLEVRGKIVWKRGVSRGVKANALVEVVQLKAGGDVLATGQADIAGNWRLFVDLVSAPGSVQAEFRDTLSEAASVR
ncbi:Ig-like domain repeat protein [Methylomonas sp. HYX-M1]|uniref:Ig-like domain repeat protein n=1 Tax=Methylomonas sp. HYX-M1 TaxID=3139307 RepID=UPI00345B9C5E